ncbi:MAG: TolC family protein, partial [Planctomycetaceae bacterium]|nr:TolC family protein [Planctomycetaceae bacterium]
MRATSRRQYVVLCAVFALTGCAETRNLLTHSDVARPPIPATADQRLDQLVQRPENPRYLNKEQAQILTKNPVLPQQNVSASTSQTPQQPANTTVEQVGFATVKSDPTTPATTGKLIIEGRTYEIQLVEQSQQAAPEPDFQYISNAFELSSAPEKNSTPVPVDLLDPQVLKEPHSSAIQAPAPQTEESIFQDVGPEVLQLNLPTALSLVGGEHPAVGLAQWRVQEAYAQLDRAQVLWLPSIQPGFSFHRHDGNYQASNAAIVDVNRNSFQYGLGAGATGAGTTPVQGISARFHLADAIFQPDISLKNAWARGHNANGVLNRQLLEVALAYLELLQSEQQLQILEETWQRTSELARLTRDFAATGQGLQADADRMQTELILLEDRIASTREAVGVASAKLAQALSLGADQPIVPLDPTVVPLALVSLQMDRGTLITTGLSNRPELMEAQALVAVACEEYRRQKYAPFVPSVLLGYSTGGFGGGPGNTLNNVNGRNDFDALLTWEVRNLGFGE